jgi:drug/metabolite transporter (DMT)-like permease
VQTGRTAGALALVCGAISFSSLSVLVTWLRDAGVGVWLQLLCRLGISLLVFLVIVRLFVRGSVRVPAGRQLLLLAANGALMLGAFTGYIVSITLGTPPGKAILLAYLSPIYTILLSAVFLGERLTGRKMLAVVVGIVGAAITLKFWDLRGLSQFQMSDLGAIAAGLFTAGTYVPARRVGVRGEIHQLQFTFWSFAFGLLWLLLLSPLVALWRVLPTLVPALPSHMEPRTLAYLAGLAIFGTTLPYGLMFAGLKRVDAGTASVLMLVEPVSVIVLSVFLLGQTPAWWQVVGGITILSAGVWVAR